MVRRSVALVLVLTFVLALSGTPTRAQGVPQGLEFQDKLRAYSIVPPGQEGDVTADELATEDYGPHYSDQLELYAKLVDDNHVTDSEIADYFHSMQFGVEGDVEDEYDPEEGVTVQRDSFGIPHIYAENLVKASFGLGYVTAEDRMWEMDLFRHAARGTLSEFAGANLLPMDIETRREGYTEEELQKMLDRFDNKFGKLGERIQRGLDAYSDGVNAHIEELKTTRADEMPAEYTVLENPPPVFPEEWKPTDTLALAVLQLRVFGETAGGELDNAAVLANFRKKFGRKKGYEVYSDFLRENDPRSYTSIPAREGKFPSQKLGRLNWKSVAIPDNAEEVAKKASAPADLRKEFLAKLGFKSPASNALIVSARESATGNPLQTGAPQVGYGNPAFFMDIDVHAPGVDFRGPAVPGASALIPLGRGEDYAWTLTTGYSDAVDVRAEKLCEPGGKKPSEDSEYYRFKGKCRKMSSREETFIVKPTVTDPPGTPPSQETKTFYRTVHGPVFVRGTVKGKPVAFVKQRFFWKRELDSIPQFYKWNTKIDSLSDFKDAAGDFTMSFNTFYADHKHIAYFHVGYYPKRKKGVSPSLPTWGTGKWEWKGRLPFFRHPKIVDPDQGWIANWNNKPARSWDNYDSAKWGPIHRVELLADQMKNLSKGKHNVTLADLVNVLRNAASEDARGIYLGPKMVRWAKSLAGNHQRRLEALSRVRKWIRGGARRLNKDRDENIDNGDAVAIFDKWYNVLIHRVYNDEIGAGKYDLLAAADAPILDGPTPQGGGYWFDFSSYLFNVFKKAARRPLARNYCDNMKTKRKESCRLQTYQALRHALKALGKKQGTDMDDWKAPAEWIKFQNFGAGSVPDIPWQNRGTHNHVVEILGKAS